MTDIAITGLGCRFPGAPDIHAYWKLLRSGERQFSAVPAERWNHGTFHEPDDRSAPNATYTDQVAFLEDVDRFAPLHYGVPPARARSMDPQHRLMLDVAREALDDAGLGRGDFDRENTGVFVGMSVSDYKDLMAAPLRAIALAEQSQAADHPGDRDAVREQARQLGTIHAFTLPGSLLNMASGTISRQFDLGGPSFVVDSACSGSLVALDQAIAHLRQGTCRIALVGGVYLNLTPDSLVGFSRLRALSATGVCRPFDERADGFVLGEGAGTVVVRPLADALADGDRVYAVIRGIGSANDGASPGPLVPTAEGQLRAMLRAYEDADVPPSSVGFIEAHGTGTAAGDGAELEALRRLRTEYPDDDPALCYLGSGKAMIGHSLSAAGIAGLIKTALVLHHRTIVPQPQTTPHPERDVSAAGLRFADTARPWPGGGAPRRAAVSSFGFGGTNVHVVLEEQPRPALSRLSVRAEGAEPQLVLLSAGSPELLGRHIEDVLDTVGHASHAPIAALAHTLGARAPLGARLAIVAADTEEFLQRLRRARRQLADGARGDLGDSAFAADAPLPEAQRRIAFLFPGQGSQRPGMLEDLYERFTAFRTNIDILSAVARRDTGFDLADLLYGGTSHGQGDAEGLRRRLTGTDVCQPLLGAVQIAATHLLAQCGVAPDLALGHSVGEFAAAAAAGALSDEETVRLLVHRGAALRRAGAAVPGGMLVVQTDKETCRRLVAGIDDVWLACFNQPRQVVVSGTPDGLAATRQACAEAGIVTAPLEVSDAFHSPRFASAEETMRSDLARRRIRGSALPFVSTVNGAVCTDPGVLRELWARHASTPVHFGDAVGTAYDQGARVFLQVTGGSSLLASVRGNLDGRGDVHVVPAGAQSPDGGRAFVRALARLAVLGVPVDPRALVAEEDRRLLDLPVAKLATESYWVPGRRPAAQAEPAAVPPRPAAHEEISMNVLTHPPANEPAGDPMDRVLQLVRLVQEQVALVVRLTETLPGQNSAAPEATTPSTAGPAPEAAIPAVPVAPVTPDAPPAPADPPESRAVADVEPAPAGDLDAATEAVLAHVARISAFPVGHLRSDQALIDDLGFDSLMLTDLFASLSRQCPQWTFDEGAALRPTVGSIAAMIASSGGEAAPAGAAPDRARRVGAAVPGQRAERGDADRGNADRGDAAPPSPPAVLTTVPASVDPSPERPEPAAPAASVAPPVVPPVAAALPEEHTRIECFPEVAAHGERLATLAGMGLPNPYFLVHEGGMTDTTVIDGRELLSFSSYNYLGMATHPQVTDAAKQAVERCGTSVSASRLLSGSRPLHLELEAELADLLGCEAAMTLTNGHATNVTVIGHLVGPGDLVVHDSLAHDSILQGCRLSGATRRPFPHNDAAALDTVLGQIRHQYRRVLIVIEGVYSMDGDIADLPALVEVKRRHGALMMIDEAHSIGTIGATGRGIGEYHGIDRSEVELWSGTLSKALASCGGYVAGSRSVVEYLRYTVPGFVYSAGMTPADTAASLAAVRLLRAEPQRVELLSENAALFARLAREAGLDIGDSHDTAIVPCIVGDSLKTLRLAEALFSQGISVNPILHPAVPEELARLRFFITCSHTPDQLRRAVSALAHQLLRPDLAHAA
ncbi:aminotransferase class I/II-fold pyridoxal phosphate-dependent enzyme [Streptomyces sp. NPDC058646]|uniref:aminotransferase class I/II-fold pyridoxal phosphate-dependent enzyme n=1 Tax=Streptomyces sp. NPDC058646 TaxID=3346574 RepID=UPI003660E254